MSNATLRIPSYRHHKPSGQAVVTLGGRDIYLGKYNTAASRASTTASSPSGPRTAARCRSAGQRSDRRGTGRRVHAARQDVLPRARRQADQRSRELQAGDPAAERTLRPDPSGGLRPAGPQGRPPTDDRRRPGTRDDQPSHQSHPAISSSGASRISWSSPACCTACKPSPACVAGRSDAKETAPVKPVPDAFVDAVLRSRVAPGGRDDRTATDHRHAIRRSHDHAGLRHRHDAARFGSTRPSSTRPPGTATSATSTLARKPSRSSSRFSSADLSAYLFCPADAEAERNGQRFGVVSPNRKTTVYPSELRPPRETSRRARQKGRETALGERYDAGHLLPGRRVRHRGGQPSPAGRSQGPRHRRRQGGACAPLAPAPAAPQRGNKSAPRARHRGRQNHPRASLAGDHRGVRRSRSRPGHRRDGPGGISRPTPRPRNIGGVRRHSHQCTVGFMRWPAWS